MKLSRKRIEMIKRNENGAFDEIYLTYYKLVKYVIYELVKNDSDAEDLAQDVFVKVFLKIDLHKGLYLENFLVLLIRLLKVICCCRLLLLILLLIM